MRINKSGQEEPENQEEFLSLVEEILQDFEREVIGVPEYDQHDDRTWHCQRQPREQIKERIAVVRRGIALSRLQEERDLAAMLGLDP